MAETEQQTAARGSRARQPESDKSPTYLLVGERLGVDTMTHLREQREAGVSWRQISLDLYRFHGLDVTEVTLRKWWTDAQDPVE